jgi:hypothetical protein
LVTTDITLYAEWIENGDSEKPEYDEFCLYANVEDFHKTAPLINAYLEHLSKNDWSDGRKLQALTKWLIAKPCVISAELVSVITYAVISTKSQLPPPPLGRIAIQLDGNGMTRYLTLHIDRDCRFRECYFWCHCTSYSLVASYYEYMKPKEVGVFTHSHITIDKVFEFINLFEHNVDFITNDRFISSLPPHYQSNIVAALHAKPYIQSFHTGVDSSNNEIFMFVWLYSMDNKDYQVDWLKTMNDFELFEGGSHPYYFIQFLVPEGKEIEWQEIFETYSEFVSRTRLNVGSQGMLIQ